MQSHRPDKINLWVSREPYLHDRGIAGQREIDFLIESLPEPVSDLLSVRWVRNTGPYRKLIPMLREADADDVIVTADDDIFYGRKWLSELIVAHADSGGLAVAARVRRKRRNLIGTEMSYLHWALINQASVVEDDFVITFGGGAVLTRAMFREVDIKDDAFLEIAPTADDIWYSQLLKANGVGVYVDSAIMRELHFIKHDHGLMEGNLVRPSSLAEKIRLNFWDRYLGLLGVSVCMNDRACDRINAYFDQRAEIYSRLSSP